MQDLHGAFPSSTLAQRYRTDGFVVSRSLVPSPVVTALRDHFWKTLEQDNAPVSHRADPPLQDLPTTELHSSLHPPLATFHWGLTGAVSQRLGVDLLPTYCMMRLYRLGDRLRVHADRHPCEHSATLPLGSSDGLAWPLEIGTDPSAPANSAPNFGDEGHRAIHLSPGETLLYRGIERRHGRMTPNPNHWSLHLFMHWVDANGPYRDLAFSAD